MCGRGVALLAGRLMHDQRALLCTWESVRKNAAQRRRWGDHRGTCTLGRAPNPPLFPLNLPKHTGCPHLAEFGLIAMEPAKTLEGSCPSSSSYLVQQDERASQRGAASIYTVKIWRVSRLLAQAVATSFCTMLSMPSSLFSRFTILTITRFSTPPAWQVARQNS